MPGERDDSCLSTDDWRRRQWAFEWDGSLLDIYVQETTLREWQKVLDCIRGGDFDAVLQSDQRNPLWTASDLLEEQPRPLLGFRVGNIRLTCHFFQESEIEFDLDPREVTEAQLPLLLRFMRSIGELTQRRVSLSPENVPSAEILYFEPQEAKLVWREEGKAPTPPPGAR